MIAHLAHDAVDVWEIGLDQTVPAAWEASLDAHERERAARFATPLLRTRYQRAHGALRAILSRYTGQQPGALAFVHGAYGKPALACGGPAFNLSHSGSVALLAVAHAPLGVDIEYLHDPRGDVATLIDAVCHPAEKAALADCDEATRRRLFYALWTRKEAYVKAVGMGLQIELSSVTFAAAPQSDTWSVLHAGQAGWQVRTLATGPAYTANICVSRPHMRIQRLAGFTSAEIRPPAFPLSDQTG